MHNLEYPDGQVNSWPRQHEGSPLVQIGAQPLLLLEEELEEIVLIQVPSKIDAPSVHFGSVPLFMQFGVKPDDGQLNVLPSQQATIPEEQNAHPLLPVACTHKASVSIWGGGLKHLGVPNGQPAIMPVPQFNTHPVLHTVWPDEQAIVHGSAYATWFCPRNTRAPSLINKE